MVKGQEQYPVLEISASFTTVTMYRVNTTVQRLRRFLTVSANIYKRPGAQPHAVQQALKVGRYATQRVGNRNKRHVEPAGNVSGFTGSLLFAIWVIFCCWQPNYQSFRLSLTVLSTVPAVIAEFLAVLLTGSPKPAIVHR